SAWPTSTSSTAAWCWASPRSSRAWWPHPSACRCRPPITRARSTRTSAAPAGGSSRPTRNALMRFSRWARATPVARLCAELRKAAPLEWRAPSLLVLLLALLIAGPAAAVETLKIGASFGSIDFAIGNSKVFRTTGSFTDWKGTVKVDDADVLQSRVDVEVNTASIQMLDAQQTNMLKDGDFFDVGRFPQMTFHSTRIERTGENTLRVDGDVTL